MSEKKSKNLLYQLKLPVFAAPMFLISNPDMVIKCCKNGIIGSFPALNQRESSGLKNWLEEITEALDENDAPYAVNLIVNPVNTRLEEDLKLCIQYKVPIIITSLGINSDLIEAIHNYGGLIFHDVTNVHHAKKAINSGVDGLIAVCSGAGGHAGTLNPFGFVSEIREFFDGYLALAGAISKGSDIYAAQIMGADLAYMGTRFINCDESSASSDYKNMIISAYAEDIIYTDAVSGIPANFMVESLKAAGYDPAHQNQTGMNTLKGFDSEAKAWKNIWSAGHGVGSIHDTVPIAEIIAILKDEYTRVKDRL